MLPAAQLAVGPYPVVAHCVAGEGSAWPLRGRIVDDLGAAITHGLAAGQCPTFDVLVERRLGALIVPVWQQLNVPAAGVVVALTVDASWTFDASGYNVRLTLDPNLFSAGASTAGEIYLVTASFDVEPGGATADATRKLAWRIEIRGAIAG